MGNNNPFTIGKVYSIDQLFESNPITNWDDDFGKKKTLKRQFEEQAKQRNKQKENFFDASVLELLRSGDKAAEVLSEHFKTYPGHPELELRTVVSNDGRKFGVVITDSKTKKIIFEKHSYSIGVQPIENLTLRRVSTGKSLRIVKV